MFVSVIYFFFYGVSVIYYSYTTCYYDVNSDKAMDLSIYRKKDEVAYMAQLTIVRPDPICGQASRQTSP